MGRHRPVRWATLLICVNALLCSSCAVVFQQVLRDKSVPDAFNVTSELPAKGQQKAVVLLYYPQHYTIRDLASMTEDTRIQRAAALLPVAYCLTLGWVLPCPPVLLRDLWVWDHTGKTPEETHPRIGPPATVRAFIDCLGEFGWVAQEANEGEWYGKTLSQVAKAHADQADLVVIALFCDSSNTDDVTKPEPSLSGTYPVTMPIVLSTAGVILRARDGRVLARFSATKRGEVTGLCDVSVTYSVQVRTDSPTGQLVITGAGAPSYRYRFTWPSEPRRETMNRLLHELFSKVTQHLAAQCPAK